MSARKGSGDHRGVKVFWDDFISKASTDSDASQNNGGFFQSLLAGIICKSNMQETIQFSDCLVV